MKSLALEKRTRIMGVLNVTTDSFSDGGEFFESSRAEERAREMISEGADMIDIGGESSRPGSMPISEAEEIKRVIPVVKALKGITLSVDTYKSGVARKALEEGASIINDITALKGDPRMADTIAEFGAGVILMHMKGTPRTMQENPEYDDCADEIFEYLHEAVITAEASGIDPGKIIIDPGIGFGKTLENNISILRHLRRFKELGKPVLVGTSRKSFLGELTGRGVSERAFGTAASISAAIMNGADIVRVHDVSWMRDVTRVIDAIKGE